MRFNLIEEPWIPVDKDGSTTELSLLDVLVRAHEFNGLSPEVPTMVPALLRQVLLPVVLEVFGAATDNSEWGILWRKGSFEAQPIRDYLAAHQDRFDLFHPTQPFGQVADLRTSSNQPKPSSLLVPAVATGNNVPLFSTRTEADPVPLTPAQAARWMLHAQCWDTAGIKSGAEGDPRANGGKTTGNPVGSLGKLGIVVPQGRNLFETLVLNLRILPDGLEPDDVPAWRQDPPSASWTERAAAGLADLFTFQSRRIRLMPEEDAGKIIVRHVLVTAGDRLSHVPEYEPHTAWRRSTEPRMGEPPFYPHRHHAGKAAWQGLDSLLTLHTDEAAGYSTSLLVEQIAGLQQRQLNSTFPLRVLTVGVEYGNQQAVVENVIWDAFPLPVTALRSEGQIRVFIEEVVAQADGLSRLVNRLDADLRRAAGGDPVPWNRGQHPGEFLIQKLDPWVRRLLGGLQREPDHLQEAKEAWWKTARRAAIEVAEELLAVVPPSAFAGHKEKTKSVGKRSGDESVMNLAAAESGFRRGLNRVLPIGPETAARRRSAGEKD